MWWAYVTLRLQCTLYSVLQFYTFLYVYKALAFNLATDTLKKYLKSVDENAISK